MPGFRISSRTHGSVDIPASNWLVALGEGLERLGGVANMDRIACESLPNGTILVRDVRTGAGFIVQPLDAAPSQAEENDEVWAAPEDTEDEQTGRERVILSALDTVLAAPSRTAAAQLALDAATKVIPAESGAVLLGERGKALVFAAAFGPEAHKLRELAIPAGTGFAGFCATRGTALTVNTPYEDERFCRAIDDITGYRTRSLLVVPVAVDHRSFGVLELINSPSQHGFDAAAIEVLARVALALGTRLAALGPVEG